MKTSSHAQKRQQQRGISEDNIKFILQNGTPIPKPGNAFEYRILKKDKPKIIRGLKNKIKVAEKAFKIGILMSNNGENIITIYHLK